MAQLETHAEAITAFVPQMAMLMSAASAIIAIAVLSTSFTTSPRASGSTP